MTKTVNKGKRLLLKSDLNSEVAFRKMSRQELIETLDFFKERAVRFPEMFYPEISLLNQLLLQVA